MKSVFSCLIFWHLCLSVECSSCNRVDLPEHCNTTTICDPGEVLYPLFICFCLFVWGLSSHSRIFYSLPLSSEGSLACHAYCDTGRPFIKVISRTHDTHTYSRWFNSVAVTTCFINLGLSRLGFQHPPFRLRVQRSNTLRQRRGLNPSCKSISLN